MIDIIVNGIESFTPDPEGSASRRIRELLAALPTEVTDDCFITMNKSTRVKVNDRYKAKRSILLVGTMGSEKMLAVADALAPMADDYEIRIVDSTSIKDHRSITVSLKALKDL